MRISALNLSNAIRLGKILFVCLLFSIPRADTPSFAQTDGTLNRSPVQITSDRMVAEKGASMVEFIGNVTAVQEDSTILADSIKIYFETGAPSSRKDSGNGQNRIKKIVSSGNVRYTAGDRKAFADQAVYTTEDDVLVLTGKAPRLETGDSFITGRKITLFRKDDRISVESDGSKRVEALFHPEDNPQGGKADKP